MLGILDLVRHPPNGYVRIRLGNVLGSFGEVASENGRYTGGRNVKFAQDLRLALESRRAPEGLKREACIWHLRELMKEHRRIFKK